MVRISALAALFLIVGCATSGSIRRGAEKPAIQEDLQKKFTELGYRCTESPTKAWLDCTHEEMMNMSFSYMPNNNFIEFWSVFNLKSDEALVDRWRSGCSEVLTDLNNLNYDHLLKVSCKDDLLILTVNAWVPDNGLSTGDVTGIVHIIDTAIRELFHESGMLKADQAAQSGTSQPAS